MGHRANYVLIEGRRPEIYFSRWGAPSIPAVLLSGPEATIAYVRALTPDEELLDEDWAEGGVLLHVDRRELRFFGGWRIERTRYLRRPLLRTLRALWPGWSVEWALFGIAELALGLGWDVGRVLVSESEDSPLLVGAGPIIEEDAVRITPEPEQAHSILTVRWSETDVRDYLLTPRSTSALSLGPRLLELLADDRGTTLPGEDDPNLPGEGAFLDATAQTLWMWEFSALDPRHPAALARRWPGWQVHGHVDGLVRQVELSGRDVSAVVVPEERAIQELVDELTPDSTTDPARLYAALTRSGQSPLADEGKISVGKGFFSADRPPLTSEERREVILRLLRNTSADPGSPSQRE